MDGGFEVSELRTLARYATPGSVAIDVGANVGIFSIVLGRAVGPFGKVVAFEPDPSNVDSLRSNIRLNQLNNVEVHTVALGSTDGRARLRLANDPAYHSLLRVPRKRETDRFVEVGVTRLDSIFQHSPTSISVMKIDVEGGELAVLEGAENLLEEARPVLLVEANDATQHDLLTRWLLRRGYDERATDEMMPWNHLFLPRGGFVKS